MIRRLLGWTKHEHGYLEAEFSRMLRVYVDHAVRDAIERGEDPVLAAKLALERIFPRDEHLIFRS